MRRMANLIAIFIASFSWGCGEFRKVSGIHATTDDAPEALDLDTAFSLGFNSLGWSSWPVVINVDDQLSNAQTQQIANAAQTWNEAVGADILRISTERFHGADAHGDDALNDSIHSVKSETRWCVTGKLTNVLATTYFAFRDDQSGYLRTADLALNAEYYLIDDAMTRNETDDRVVVDLESLALHELGHFLGLGHVNSAMHPNSVMTPVIVIGEKVIHRTLDQIDIERIQALYAPDREQHRKKLLPGPAENGEIDSTCSSR